MTYAKPPAQNAHRLLKFIYLQLKLTNQTLKWLAAESGVSYKVIRASLKGKHNISLASTEAVLNTLGYTMKATPLEDHNDREAKKRSPKKDGSSSSPQKLP